MDDYQVAQCLGKIKFDSRARAQKASDRKSGRNIYRCRQCHTWHVGNRKPGGKKPFKRPPPKRGW